MSPCLSDWKPCNKPRTAMAFCRGFDCAHGHRNLPLDESLHRSHGGSLLDKPAYRHLRFRTKSGSHSCNNGSKLPSI